MRAGNRKQAMVPEGATVLEPVGTAPGLVVPRRTARRWSCCPGRPASCSRCGARRSRRRRCRPRWRAPAPTSSGSCGCSGRRSPRSPRRCARPSATASPLDAPRDHDLPAARRDRDRDASSSRRPPRTTTRSRPPCSSATGRRCSRATARRSTSWWRRRCSARPSAPSRSRSPAPAGLMAGRLTDRAGSSAYVLGGLTVVLERGQGGAGGRRRGR